MTDLILIISAAVFILGGGATAWIVSLKAHNKALAAKVEAAVAAVPALAAAVSKPAPTVPAAAVAPLGAVVTVLTGL